MNARVKAVIKYLLPGILVSVILFLVFYVKGIYPFGEKTIAYYDMAQQTVPFYYHIYDFLHGNSALFFDWYSNLSASYTMGMANSGCFSPFILFFYFVPRALIMQSLSYLLVIKTGAMALSMYLFLNKGFCRRSAYIWKLLCSLGYALGGYVLLYYTMLTWFDIMIFLPLFALAVLDILKTGKIRYYVMMLTLCFINNYYLTIMLLIYLFLAAGTYLLLIAKKEQRGRLLLKLAAGTVTGVGLSTPVLLPALYHTMASKRFSESMSMLSILQSAGADQYYMKYWMLLGLLPGLAILAVCLLPVLFSKKAEAHQKKQGLLAICVIAYVLLLIPFENINLLWSFGSYVQYPLRSGFLISFSVLTAACFYSPEKEETAPVYWYNALFSALVAILLAFVLMHFYTRIGTISAVKLFPLSVVYMGLLFLIYAGFLLAKKYFHQVFSMALLAIVGMELIFNAYVLIGVPSFTTGFAEGPEQQSEYVETVEKMAAQFEIEQSTISRIKNPDTSLNANYPIIMRRAAISGWTTAIEESFQTAAERMGYSTHYTRVLDAGGTAFSDALLGISETISCVQQNRQLYQIKAAAGGYTIYKNKFSLPFGLLVDTQAVDKLRASAESDWAVIQNAFYQAVSGQEQQLITSMEVSDEKSQIQVTGKKLVYLDTELPMEIEINGEKLVIPTIGDMNNTEYPAEFNNGLQLLGVFENETVSLELQPQTYQNHAVLATLGFMDYARLEELCSNTEAQVQVEKCSNTALKLLVDAKQEEQTLMLPLTWHRSQYIMIDGEKAEAEPLGLFTIIKLPKGCRQVTLRIVPQGLPAGVIICLLTAMCVLGYLLFAGKQGTETKIEKTGSRVLSYLYFAVFFAVLICVYIIPILFFIAGFIMRRL